VADPGQNKPKCKRALLIFDTPFIAFTKKYTRPACWMPVAPTCNPLTTWEAGIRRLEGQGQPGQMVFEITSPK
jgi:hypothetical protein